MNTQIITITNPPASLVQACLRSQSVTAKNIVKSGDFLKTGSRNTDLASIAGMLRKKGADYEEIYETLSVINSSSKAPLPDSEVQAISKSISRYEITLDGFTHDSLADLMVNKSVGKIIYCVGQGFYNFDTYWRMDSEGLLVLQRMRDLVRKISADLENHKEHCDEQAYAKLKKAISKLKSADFMKKSLQLVKADPKIRMEYAEFEKNKHLINFQNGTYNLRTNSFGAFNPADRLTHILDFAYDPEATCPLFEKFLSEILTKEQIGLILRILGYSLLGDGKEQRFFILHGRGKNGKSTLLQVIESILDPLMVNVQAESISGKLDGTIRNDLARLVGKRLMITNETRAGSIMDAPLLKQITGGDKITARFLHREYFEFQPICVPVIVTNHLPVIDGSDFAIERRTCLISFDQTVQNADTGLPEKLLNEKAGIFNLILKGLADYQAHGLAIPPSVQERTKAFVNRSNLMKGFFLDRLALTPDKQIRAATLYQQYQFWCHENGYKAMSMNLFKDAFERETGIEQIRDSQGRCWPGISAKP